MSTISGVLNVRPAKKGEIHEVHYTSKKGKPAVLELKPHIQAYAGGKSGDPVVVEMEGNATVRAVVPGKEKELPKKPTQKKTDMRDAPNYKFGGNLPKPGTSPYNFTPYTPDVIVGASTEPRKWSGEIICGLSALTPLLVSGRQGKQGDATVCAFMQVDGKPVIPGTSLKGMLRSLMEILSFSGMEPMNRRHLYWREVAAKRACKYHTLFPANLQGGLLHKQGAKYSLTPTEVSKTRQSGWIEMRVGRSPKDGKEHSYYFKRQPQTAQALEMKEPEKEPKIVTRLWEQMTPDQIKRWKDARIKEALAGEGLPVFYRGLKNKPEELGFCRYFRVAYKHTPYDLAWPPDKKTPRVDFARGIFGHAVREESLAGRIAITACEMRGQAQEFRVVLGGPKPTCLGFYLDQEQRQKENKLEPKGQGYSRGSMASYDDAYPAGCLRGRKLYWHHEVDAPPPSNGNEKVMQILRPLAKGACGQFAIRVKNLTDSELGCLFEALELLPQCAHKLGMGKPLGFGSVKISINQARIRENGQKYASLASRLESAASMDMDAAKRGSLRETFREAILKAIKETDYYSLPQIRNLYRMLNYENRPDRDDVKYMKIGEFRKNPLLPGPAQVLGDKLEAVDRLIKKP